MLFSIKAACRQLGIKETTLRAWEERYGAVQPTRRQNNQRFYSPEDLIRIELLLQAKALGHSIALLAKKSSSQIESIIRHTTKIDELGDSQTDHAESGSLRSPSTVIKKIFMLLENFDLLGIQLELDRFHRRLGTREYILTLLVPLFQFMNRRVEAGRLSVPREHSFSSLIRMQLLHDLYVSQRSNAANATGYSGRLRISAATLDGDTHELGLLMASNLCSLQGHIVHYYGASIPMIACAEAVTFTRSHVLLLSLPSRAKPIGFAACRSL